MKKKLFLVISIIFMIAVLAACNDDEGKESKETDNEEQTGPMIEFPSFETKDDLSAIDKIAEYQGGTVTGEELAQYIAVDAFLNPYAPVDNVTYHNDSLKYLVMERSIVDEVEDASWAEEKADGLWDEIVSVYDEETIQSGYDTLGISEEDIRNYALDFYKVQQYFKGEVTDEEIEEFYESAKASVTTASFRHILINTQKMNEQGAFEEVRTDEEALEIMEEIQTKLDEGTSFNDLADEYNEDPGSKETSGLYENSLVAQLDPNFASAVMEQEINEVGEPVKSAYGYHLIVVEKRETTPLEEVRDIVEEQLAFQKSNDYLKMKVPALISYIDDILVEKKEENNEE